MDQSKAISLLTPYTMGKFNLSHRVVLPPLSRNRSYNNIPQQHAIEYYSQRTTKGGFIISESAGACDISEGCPNMPGIWKKEQVEAWKPIVNAVHEKGGIFFCQIWHTGLVSNYSQQKWWFIGGEWKNSCDAEEIRQNGSHFSSGNNKGASLSQLTQDQINCIINDFKVASVNAIEAGFDGVEILCSNGFLIDQFVNVHVSDRCRLALDVVEAVANEIGADKVGIKLSPFDDFNGSNNHNSINNPESVGIYMSNELNKLNILYLHVTEPRMIKLGDQTVKVPNCLFAMRAVFKGTFIATGGYTKCDGDKAVADKYCDLVSFGRLFLANPDLPKRFEIDAPLNKHQRSSFYIQDPVIGYTDYPFLEVAS